MSKVYRYHDYADDKNQSHAILLRKRKARKAEPVLLIAADETTITDEYGTHPIEKFYHMAHQSFVTLTRRESDYIALANPGARPPRVLEDDHPWLPRRSYVPNSAIGYQAIRQIQSVYGDSLISASEFCDKKWNTICNAIRRKSPLDSRFHFAWHLPIQDVFVLEERRTNRSVVALDVNAMYSACMQQELPKPSGLRHVVLNRRHQLGERLAVGLYRCRLSLPITNFIKTYNPFRTFFAGRRLQACLDELTEVDLNEFEVDYYARHFEQIHFIDAVIADEAIPHPLAKEARRAFARRLSYRDHENKPFANREKFLATLLSSCASRPKRYRRTFSDRSKAMSYLKQNHGIAPLSDEPEISTDSWMGRLKGAAMYVGSKEATINVPDLDGNSACFMLGQRIVAKGRVRLLELMELVVGFGKDIKVCYVNIDSIHVSVPKKQMDEVLENLGPQLSSDMGALKIEAVTDHGLWLEPGRYWLYSDKVEKFKNRSISDRIHPFKDRSFHVTSRRVGDLHVPIRVSLRMDKSMSPARSLDFCAEKQYGFVRQRVIKFSSKSTYSETLDKLEANRSFAISKRLEAFTRLKESFEKSCPATSGQN